MVCSIGHRPAIVFLTAFEEYALRAFEDAFDYLLKPEEERTDKTLNRLRRNQIRRQTGLVNRATALYPVQVSAQPSLADAGRGCRYVNSISGVFVMSARPGKDTELTAHSETRTRYIATGSIWSIGRLRKSC